MINPWFELPSTSPYILPNDDHILRNHKHYINLRLDTVPEPYVGGLNNAKIVFLALNPGFSEDDVNINLNLTGFKTRNLENMQDPFNSEFYYFSGGFEQTGGYKWWTNKLKPLLNSGVTIESLRKHIMVIEYFPYHSVNYKHINLNIDSQAYSNYLVREALKMNKIIVLMRGRKLWLNSVPELEGKFMQLNNPRNVTISINNLGDVNFKILIDQIL